MREVPELSGFEVLVLTREIGSSVLGSFVSNVYSIGESQAIRFRAPGGRDTWVIASPKRGAWVSESLSERMETSSFTSRLRKEVTRAKVSEVSQLGLDRVYDMRLGEGDRLRHLILEMAPPGEILVTDGDGIVLEALREVRSPKRRLTRGGHYRPPSQSRESPENARRESVLDAARSGGTAGKALGSRFAMPRKYVREALYRLGVPESAPASALEDRASEVAETLTRMVAETRDHPYPCVCDTAEGKEIFSLKPESAPVSATASSISQLCDALLLPAVLGEALEASETAPDKEKQYRAQAEELRREEKSLSDQAAKAREAAVLAARSSTPEELSKRVLESGVGSPRKEEWTPAAASSAIYDRAKELEAKAQEVREAAKRIERKASRETSTQGEKRGRLVELRRSKVEWYEKFRWFFTSGGKLAVGGRDAQTNSILVKRHAEQGDTVFHADLFGSPFFLLKGGSEQSEEEVREVAGATVSFSSAWKTGLASADAYWVTPDQVSTTAPSGEYLSKGSFMIRGRKNFVPRNPVEIAVGLDELGRVLSGPEAALRTSTENYVLLRPAREKASDTAKTVARELDESGAVLRSRLDDVMRALPSGGGKVLRRRPRTIGNNSQN